MSGLNIKNIWIINHDVSIYIIWLVSWSGSDSIDFFPQQPLKCELKAALFLATKLQKSQVYLLEDVAYRVDKYSSRVGVGYKSVSKYLKKEKSPIISIET